MPRQKSADQIVTLRKQQAEIAARLKEAEAKARRQEAEETARRVAVLGRVISAHMEADPDDPLTRSVLVLLGKHLTRKSERMLFPALLSLDQAGVSPDSDLQAGS